MGFTLQLEQWLFAQTSAVVTEYFFYATFAVFILALIEGRRAKHSRFLEYAPTLMTSLGILGTFIGVVIGLLHFDTANIDISIPKLLDGLKTAFITSIVGMVFAIIFNAIDAWIFAPRRAANEFKQDITPRHIHEALEQQVKHLKALIHCVTGGEEVSLSSQVKQLRVDVNDNNRQSIKIIDQIIENHNLTNKLLVDQKDEISAFARQVNISQTAFSNILWKKLEEFSEMMSKNATAQIIQALEEVIRNFNDNLTEQFGENFKRLDESVKKLVDWQIEYKEQIEVMASQYRECVDALKDTSAAVAAVDASCQGIPVSMDKLSAVMQVNQHQIQELQRHLEAFVSMRDAAVEAVPTINQKLDEISQQMLSGANEMRVALNEGAEQFRDSVKVTNASVGELANTVKNTSEQLSETLKDTAQEISSTSRDTLARMQDSAKGIQTSIADTARNMDEQSRKVNEGLSRSAAEFERSNTAVLQAVSQSAARMQEEVRTSSEKMMNSMRQQLEQSVAGMDAHMRDAIGKTGNTINKQLEQLETATAREIERAMNEMGTSLVQITSRFVKDYEMMVGKMDDVIKSAGQKVTG